MSCLCDWSVSPQEPGLANPHGIVAVTQAVTTGSGIRPEIRLNSIVETDQENITYENQYMGHYRDHHILNHRYAHYHNHTLNLMFHIIPEMACCLGPEATPKKTCQWASEIIWVLFGYSVNE